MKGDPIAVGSALATGKPRLVPKDGSTIKTDEYGIDRGTIRYQLGDQGQASAARPARGSAYIGSLPQFDGFLVDDSRIIGAEGKACFIDVDYCAINTAFKPVGVPKTQVRWIRTPFSTFDPLFESITKDSPNFALTEPTITIKYADTKSFEITNETNLFVQKGTTGVGRYLPDAPNLIIPIIVVVTTQEIDSRGFQKPGTPTAVNLTYAPNPAGWQIMDIDSSPCAGGALYGITLQLRRFYFFWGAALATAKK